MKDLTITLQDRPGTLADLGEATGKAGINIEGVCVTTGGGSAEVHVLVDDAAAAREALGSAGIAVAGESDVLVIDVEDRPGTLGEVARKLADAGLDAEEESMLSRSSWPTGRARSSSSFARAPGRSRARATWSPPLIAAPGRDVTSRPSLLTTKPETLSSARPGRQSPAPPWVMHTSRPGSGSMYGGDARAAAPASRPASTLRHDNRPKRDTGSGQPAAPQAASGRRDDAADGLALSL
jgi:hypothetical protein